MKPALVALLLLLLPISGALVTTVLAQEPEAQTGLYLVLAEALAAEHLAPPSKDQQVVRFDYEFLREDEREPPKYLLLANRPDVPLALAKPPEKKKGNEGRPELFLELTKEAAADLAKVTRANVGNQVAFLVDGEVVSTHTIREAITGGQFRVSRCTDNACEFIYARLMER
jgi:preprotein translocase subunit SecD